jgi:hypothetical protein
MRYLILLLGLLGLPLLVAAKGLDVTWTGPNTITISAQPDGLPGSTTICTPGKRVYLYGIISGGTQMRQILLATGSGVPSGNCSESLSKVLPISLTLLPGEYFWGIGKELTPAPCSSGVCISGEWNAGNSTGDGWKPQPPPKPSCSANNVTIDYRTLSYSAVQGAKASSFLYITCTDAAVVKVSTSGYIPSTGLKLNSDGSLLADLFINDVAGPSGTLVNVYGGAVAQVPVSSVLKVNGTLTGGDFNGSAVITVEVQ